MKLIFTSILLLLACVSFAQRQNVYFLKNNGNYVDTRDSADYIRVVREPDSASTLYNVFEFYKDGKRKMIGKSSKIDPPRLEGQCLNFYANGFKQSVATYTDNQLTGLEIVFYPNGKADIVNEYPDSGNIYNTINNNFLIKANYDSLGKVLVENGNGYYKAYDDKFKYIKEEGPVKDGMRDSIWKGISKDFELELTFTEIYNKGKLVSGTAISQDGQTSTYIKARGVPPQFKGGDKAFGTYLGSNIVYPEDARRNNIEGIVIISFVVEKNGKISDIKVNKSVRSDLDGEAVRVIRYSPRWIPGTEFGKPIRVSYDVPINFSLTN